MRSAWHWIVTHYGAPTSVSQEYSDWWRICGSSSYSGACTGAFKSHFNPMNPSALVGTQEAWHYGFASLVSSVSAGTVVPLVLKNTQASRTLTEMAQAAIDDFASGYQKAILSQKVHGNSLDSDAETFLYRLEDDQGNYLKTGISDDPDHRYSKDFMSDKNLKRMMSGTRREMTALEQFIVERDPGPLNFENFAGAFANDIPPAAFEGDGAGAGGE